MSDENTDFWQGVLAGTDPRIRGHRRFNRFLPTDPRCKLCSAPFAGIGGVITRVTGRQPWAKNPQICTGCFIGLQQRPGGAEIDVMLLFADVRGSTPLAESLGASAFGALMNRFFSVGSRALNDSGAFVEKFVGDEVAGVYVPGWLDPDYPKAALVAARRILRETGNAAGATPWVPVGVGLHFGRAYVGTIGADQVTDFGVLGDTANTAARLASAAAAGEVLASEDAVRAIGASAETAETRELQLKGVARAVRVSVMRA